MIWALFGEQDTKYLPLYNYSLCRTCIYINVIDMKKALSCLILSICIYEGVDAQSYQALRDSLSAATETLSYKPDSLDLRLKKASWNVLLEQWQYARDEYDYVLRRDPNNIAALFYRAYVNEKQHRYNFARLDYESLISIIPRHFEARLGLALLNQKDNHFTEAMDQINKLVDLYPDSAVAYAARAGMELERKMYDLAEFDYSKAIEIDPSNIDYRLGRVNVRIILKRKDEAREDLDALVKKGIPRANLAEFYQKCR